MRVGSCTWTLILYHPVKILYLLFDCPLTIDNLLKRFHCYVPNIPWAYAQPFHKSSSYFMWLFFSFFMSSSPPWMIVTQLTNCISHHYPCISQHIFVCIALAVATARARLANNAVFLLISNYSILWNRWWRVYFWNNHQIHKSKIPNYFGIYWYMIVKHAPDAQKRDVQLRSEEGEEGKMVDCWGTAFMATEEEACRGRRGDHWKRRWKNLLHG